MTETSIKQQARRFAEKHDISYTRALAGVTEPLYRLKAELFRSEVDHPGGRKGFRITGSWDTLFEVDAEGKKRIRGTSIYLTQIEDEDPGAWRWHRKQQDWLLEVARRTQILRDSGARNFWEQRQFYRAGIVSETLEPLPNYNWSDTSVQELLYRWNGSGLGIIDVALGLDGLEELAESGYKVNARRRGSFALRKISLDDFQALLLSSQP